MWVLAVLAASETSQWLSILLSVSVVVHAIFCMVGYCIINHRVRENLHRSFLRCMGRKVPLMEASLVVSSSSQNVGSNPRTPGGFIGGNYETARRNIGISASSTTSRSTAKTSSSPYRSDGQLRQTSTSTSNYNSNSDMPSYMRGYDGGGEHHRGGASNTRHKEEKRSRRHRKDSDSGSDTDGRSLDLASSHSSDDDESRVGGRESSQHRSLGVSAAPYLPNITEHVTASTPPELNVVQSPQLFPSVKPVYAPRWSSQLPDAYLPSSNVITRWSQDTMSDNEAQTHSASSPNPLPNPDLTETTYLAAQQHHHAAAKMPPSILENIQENYNFQTSAGETMTTGGYDNDPPYSRGLRTRDYQDNNYGDYETNNYRVTTATGVGSGGDQQMDNLEYTGPTQIVGHMRTFHNDNSYLKDTLFHKQHPGYRTSSSRTSSPYISREHLSSELYSPRSLYEENGPSVQTLLKNDYQVSGWFLVIQLLIQWLLYNLQVILHLASFVRK